MEGCISSGQTSPGEGRKDDIRGENPEFGSGKDVETPRV